MARDEKDSRGDPREDVDTGGEPETVGVCTNCGEVYPVQVAENGELRPVGVEGTCSCGNSTFRSPVDE